MAFAPPGRHLVRARDLADARYREGVGVADMAKAAGLSRAHFSREFRRVFGVSPHAYLLTRRLERAAALLRTTDRSVLEVCLAVGLRSVGSRSQMRPAFAALMKAAMPLPFGTGITPASGTPRVDSASFTERGPR